MAIKESEITIKTRKEIERLQKEYDERIPISQKEIINGQLKTTLFFGQEEPFVGKMGKDEYWRYVTGILVEDGNSKLDLCALASKGTRFETYSAYTGNPIRGPRIPIAETLEYEDKIVVVFNPDAFKTAGGSFIVLHEIGHSKLISKGLFKNSAKARRMLCNFPNQKEKIGKEEILQAIELLNSCENAAWQFALKKYHQIKNSGLNLAPQMSDQEIENYPQVVYDWGYNLEILRAAEAVGREEALVWRKNDF